MKNNGIYQRLKKLLNSGQSQLNILEEQIDLDLQLEYFEVSRKAKKDINEKEVLRKKEMIFDGEISVEEKKYLLARLASLEEVKAYRSIEKYADSSKGVLQQWAILALQESRMNLQSKLLGKKQVFISTGLGGNASGLRYCLVLSGKPGNDFGVLNKKVVRNEFEIILKEYSAELESIEYTGNYIRIMSIVPLEVQVVQMFAEIVRECNRYGQFLLGEFILTNVRIPDLQEIEAFFCPEE